MSRNKLVFNYNFICNLFVISPVKGFDIRLAGSNEKQYEKSIGNTLAEDRDRFLKLCFYLLCEFSHF